MQNILIVIDMQNDFINGVLGTPEAIAIVPSVVEKVKNFSGSVFFTQDTHDNDYMDTQEGRNLPVPHCIRDTQGWQICAALQPFCRNVIYKKTFGSDELAIQLKALNQQNPIQSITFVGLCTDICVISNAMLIKAFLPETKIIVDAKCCAGVTPRRHHIALQAMEMCQIQIENNSY